MWRPKKQVELCSQQDPNLEAPDKRLVCQVENALDPTVHILYLIQKKAHKYMRPYDFILVESFLSATQTLTAHMHGSLLPCSNDLELSSKALGIPAEVAPALCPCSHSYLARVISTAQQTHS